MKKFFAIIISAVLTLGAVSVPALAADFDDGVSLNEEISENAAQNGSIVELIKFNAERSTSEAVRREIMMINADIGYSIEPSVRVADRELLDETYEGNFEIRAYPFVSDKFLQYIATSIEYPTYGRDPYA
jgi:hypothetical protein